MAAKLRGLALKQVIRSFTKPATISKDSSSRVRQFHSSKRLLTTANHGMSILESEIDRYGSVKVDVGKLSVDLPEENFHQLLKDSLQEWVSAGRKAVWLHVPIAHSKYISAASQEGFSFHHAEGGHAALTLWLNDKEENRLPQFATHQVGVAGIVVNEDTKQVLAIQDKGRSYGPMWKFPGGLSDLGEDIGQTAEREVFEETGVKAEFQSVLAFRQQHTHPSAFGRSDLYIVCRLRPLTFDINPCETEIQDCKWMSLDDLEATGLTPITKRLINIMRYGFEEGFERVDLTHVEYAAVYKGMKYKLYNSVLPEKFR